MYGFLTSILCNCLVRTLNTGFLKNAHENINKLPSKVEYFKAQSEIFSIANRRKTSENITFCSIKMAHRRTYIFGLWFSMWYTHHYIIRNCFTWSKLQFSKLSYVISSQVCILGSQLWRWKFLILNSQTADYQTFSRDVNQPAMVTLCISFWLFWISGAHNYYFQHF